MDRCPQATFGVLFVTTLIGTLWMHATVVHMLHQASPELADKFEKDQPGVDASEIRWAEDDGAMPGAPIPSKPESPATTAQKGSDS